MTITTSGTSVSLPADTDPGISELVADLRTLTEAFEEVNPQEMTTEFYIHAFNELDVVVRALLAAIEDTRR